MDWIHCNACFFLPCQLPKREFKLTSCGHIFCQFCEQSGTVEKCKVCGNKCTTAQLSSQMAQEVQEYFQDSEAALGKLVKAMEFQKSHRQRISENYRKVVEKYNKIKVHYLVLEEEHKKLKDELAIHKKQQTMNVMTPPQPKSYSQLPLFSRNSQASQAICQGMSQSGVRTPRSFYMTPRNSQPFRIRQNVTPPTPESDASSGSPASVSPLNQMSQPYGRVNVQQRAYSPGLTPPISSLRMLSFNSQRNRYPTRN